MKINITRIGIISMMISMFVGSFMIQSCDDEPDKYKVSNGKPEVLYARITSEASSDSLIEGAFMDNLICLVGNNFRSITELYFNDQKAILNTSYITDNTLLVTIPKSIPAKVTNKIYMVTNSNDMVDYDFKVYVPSPTVSSMSCEYAKIGELATIYGDYFIDDPNVPLTITMAGNIPVKEITNITKTAVTFKIPDGAESGYVNVTSLYGTGRSHFQYMDKRNILFDMETAPGNGWRHGNIQGSNPDGISGNYLIFKGAQGGDSGSTWDEDNFSFNYWPENSNSANLFDSSDWSNMVMKFEANIPDVWSAAALQIIFTSASTVSMESATNSFIADDNIPRGLWNPWANTADGTYSTNGWVTVSIPLSRFKYTADGSACGTKLSKDSFAGLTMFVFKGGINGTDCNPTICIDNVRVVPAD